jgi:hypothetical protein
LRWKARESRVAARLCGDLKGRLEFLKMAQIYDRLARQALNPEPHAPSLCPRWPAPGGRRAAPGSTGT